MNAIRGVLQVRARWMAAIVMMALVVGGFWWQLASRSGRGTAGSGPAVGTPTIVVTTVPSATTGSAQATASPDPSTATILLQTSHVPFFTQPTTTNEVIIDPTGNGFLRIAVDGTGQVSGFFKTISYVPTFANKPYAWDGSDIYQEAPAGGAGYIVPPNCAQLSSSNAAVENATNALSNAIDSYKQSTGGDVGEFVSWPSTAYPISYDTAHAACDPAPGYTQTRPFAYTMLEPASIRLPFFRASDATAYRIQQAKAHAPANYVFETIAPCIAGDVVYISTTAANVPCNVGGQYRWNWTAAGSRMLANQIAGKDPATAASVLAQYPGADIYRSQGISFQLSGSTKLPTDPSHITFKIYDSVLIGTSGVQTTGTPLVLP